MNSHRLIGIIRALETTRIGRLATKGVGVGSKKRAHIEATLATRSRKQEKINRRVATTSWGLTTCCAFWCASRELQLTAGERRVAIATETITCLPVYRPSKLLLTAVSPASVVAIWRRWPLGCPSPVQPPSAGFPSRTTLCLRLPSLKIDGDPMMRS